MGQLVATRPVVVAIRLATAPSHYMIFAQDNAMFAIGMISVSETLDYDLLIETATKPAFIRGLIELRDGVVPVMDLSLRFGGRPTQIGQCSRIVIATLHGDDSSHQIGIIFDIASPASEAVLAEAPLSPGSGRRADFIFAMGKIAGRSVVALNADELMSAEEITKLTANMNVPKTAVPRLVQ